MCLINKVVFFTKNQHKRIVLTSSDQKSLYTVGSTFAKKIQNLDLSKKEIDIVILGITDRLQNKLQIDTDASQQLMQSFFNNRLLSKVEQRKEAGKQYLAQHLKKGFKTTTTGL